VRQIYDGATRTDTLLSGKTPIVLPPLTNGRKDSPINEVSIRAYLSAEIGQVGLILKESTMSAVVGRPGTEQGSDNQRYNYRYQYYQYRRYDEERKWRRQQVNRFARRGSALLRVQSSRNSWSLSAKLSSSPTNARVTSARCNRGIRFSPTRKDSRLSVFALADHRENYRADKAPSSSGDETGNVEATKQPADTRNIVTFLPRVTFNFRGRQRRAPNRTHRMENTMYTRTHTSPLYPNASPFHSADASSLLGAVGVLS